MPVDYRFDPFQDVLNPVTISGETHTVPTTSPYTIRLGEVPLRETPSTIKLTIDGITAEEVSSAPAAGQFWPDYSTGADGDDGWNTGTVLFNAADAGKAVAVTYSGTGTLVDNRFKTHIFTASGTITAPAWATHAIISGCGGGGGGGGGANENNINRSNGGGGGGGAECVISFPVKVVAGTAYAVTIGAGGAGGQSYSFNPAAGGTTSFGALLSLSGGGAATNGGPSSTGAGGAKGDTLSVLCSAGGSTVATAVNGAAGGSTAFGLGGAAAASGNAGNAGNDYGAGGGGGGYGPRASRIGGAGTPGILIIRWVRA